MAACPNCGRQTMRTEDWACQWCGYPLLGGGYKKIDKTFKQLQAERRLGVSEAKAEQEIEPEYESEELPEPEPPKKSAPRPAPKPIPRAESRPVVKPPPEPVPKPEPEPEEGFEPEEAIEPELEVEPEAAAAPEPEPIPAEPVSRPKPPPMPELKIDPVPEPEAAPAVDSGQVLTRLNGPSGEIKISIDELNAAYQADKLAAHTRLTDKFLTITGTVEKIFVKEHLDIRYIVLTGGRGISWKVRCTFDQKNAAPLHHLSEGGQAAVRGKYDGYGNNIILKTCSIVS